MAFGEIAFLWNVEVKSWAFSECQIVRLAFLPSLVLANFEHKAENKLRSCVFGLLERGLSFWGA
jgi:hypothetical protein